MVSEFILRLKETLSSGMTRAASNVQRSYNRISSGAQSVARSVSSIDASARRTGTRGAASMAVLERALRRLEYRRSITVDTSQLSRANRQIQGVQRELDRMRNTGIGNGAGGGSGGDMSSWIKRAIAGYSIKAAITGVGALAGMGMQADAQRTSFETMAGKQAGGQLFNDLTKFANDSIFGKEVYQNSQTMLAFGASAKEVMPDLKMLGDVSMGNKERLASLSLAYSQIRSTGRLMGQDLLQLVNAGFNPLQTISEKTGLTMGELKQRMEEGRIPFSMVKKAFQDATGEGGRFFNMTNKIAETPFGKWEALKGQISGIGVEFGTALLPLSSAFMDIVKPFVSMLPGMIGAMMPSINQFAKQLMPALSTVGEILMGIIPPAFKLLTSLGSALLMVLRPILKVLELFTSSFGRLFSSIADKISWLVDKITSVFAPEAATATENMMGGIADTITDNKDKVTGAMNNVIDSSEMNSMFEAAGKKHGQLYAQELQDTVASITLKMPQQQALATWATVNGSPDGKPLVGPGSTDPYGDYLEKPKTAREILDMAPAILRQVGLNQGRDAFEKLAKSYENPNRAIFGKDADVISKGIKEIAQEQRAYLIGLANGGGPKKAVDDGYEFSAGKGKKKKGVSSTGVTHSGPKIITINFMKEFIGKLELNSLNVKEGAGEIEDIIQESVLRVFYSLKSQGA